MLRIMAVALLMLGAMGCAAPKDEAFILRDESDLPPAQKEQAGKNQGEAPGEDRRANEGPLPQVTRKIIYTGQIEIIVTSVEMAGNRVREITEQKNGYVASYYIDSTSGDRRQATFTIRLPVAHFREAMEELAALGHATVSRIDSKDVTDEYYDLESRIQTKQDEEKALRELLGKSTDKLENLLMIRKELARVREEIESAQGRLNKLTKLTELTTITVKLYERKQYVPPTAPSFGKRISDTLTASSNQLVIFVKNLVLIVIALVPWSPVLVLVFSIFYLICRRIRRLLFVPSSVVEVVRVERAAPE